MRFTLEFSDSDFEGKGWERPSITFWFDITLPFEFDSEEWCDWDDEVLLDQVSNMEEYGVHDFTGSGDKSGKWVEFGYNSYEIKQDKWEEVAQKWHDWFVGQGFAPGLIHSPATVEYEEQFKLA